MAATLTLVAAAHSGQTVQAGQAAHTTAARDFSLPRLDGAFVKWGELRFEPQATQSRA